MVGFLFTLKNTFLLIINALNNGATIAGIG